jgi:ABC-type Zn uptake system ZnuABC Zn-binding protein ZnuA
MPRKLACIIACFALVAATCGDDDGDTTTASPDEAGVRVATTVAPITSIVANIGGDRVSVTGIVPEGTNSHTFEPKPSDARALSEARVIFINGLMLEEPTKELALQNKGDATEVVELGALTITPEQYIFDFSFPEEEGRPNPHLWTNPPMVKAYAASVRDTLTKLDPDGAAYFAANYEAYAARIDQLDQAMRTAFETVPAERRQLLTYHDAYAYFGRDYGWDIVGAIQVSDFDDPTPKEVAALIDQVDELGLPAIFGSEVFPSPVLEQIASETGAAYYDDLRDDDLPGSPGDPDHNLLALLRFNYSTIVSALGGDPAAIDAYVATDVVPDNAYYPQ